MARKPIPPMKSRQARAKEKLVADGGRRISINLPANVVERLDYRISRGDMGSTQTAVILYCLRRL